MADLQVLANLIPAEGMSFDAWKSAIIAQTGRPLSNGEFVQLRKQGFVQTVLNPVDGSLRVVKGQGA